MLPQNQNDHCGSKISPEGEAVLNQGAAGRCEELKQASLELVFDDDPSVPTSPLPVITISETKSNEFNNLSVHSRGITRKRTDKFEAQYFKNMSSGSPFGKKFAAKMVKNKFVFHKCTKII